MWKIMYTVGKHSFDLCKAHKSEAGCLTQSESGLLPSVCTVDEKPKNDKICIFMFFVVALETEKADIL